MKSLGQQVVHLQVVLVAGQEHGGVEPRDTTNQPATSAALDGEQHLVSPPLASSDSATCPFRSCPLPAKDPDFPQLEEEVLERWRERDVFHESMRRREGAPPCVFYEGPPTANGRPGSHHVLARVFKDIFPRYKTMRGLLRRAQGRLGLPRPAGRDRGREAARLQVARPTSRRYGIAEFNAKCRESVFAYLEEWDAADRADRLLGRPRRRVPHARPELHRVGLVGAEADLGQGPALRGPQGRALLPALRHRAVLARGRAGLQGRRGPVASTCASRSPRPAGALREGDDAAGLDDDAVDAGLQRRRRGRPRADLRAHARDGERAGRGARRRACSARTPRSLDRFRGRGDARRALRAAVPVHPRARRTARRATPCCPATSSPPRTAPASCTPRSPSARTTTGSAPSRA